MSPCDFPRSKGRREKKRRQTDADTVFDTCDRAIKMTLANEGLEAQKKDEEINARKRKKEAEKNWEGELKFSSYR